jgi:serine/threonine protein kinase
MTAAAAVVAGIISSRANDTDDDDNLEEKIRQQQNRPTTSTISATNRTYYNRYSQQQLLLLPRSSSSSSFCCKCEEASAPSSDNDTTQRRLNIQRSRTMRILSTKAVRSKSLTDAYDVDWQNELGVGAFGRVYVATSRHTNEIVALKRIPKSIASREDFQRETEALLRIQKWGGHPHICALREHFEGRDNVDDDECYYLILDFVGGGEMFDHLVNHGAYSEADAARLVREVASALDYLHGIGVVHNDIKPENLMLSTVETRDGSIQLVDFGCAEVEGEDDDDDDHDIDDLLALKKRMTTPHHRKMMTTHDGVDEDNVLIDDTATNNNKDKPSSRGGFTPAYSCPEAFANRDATPQPPADMWALGVIVYIMLTGVHPFDITGRATDEEVEADICNPNLPLPLGHKHPYTKHLSSSAIDLITRLMERDPKKRLSAYDMLHHPWVTGVTASKRVMAGSDKRLIRYRRIKTRLQTQFFADAVGWSDEAIQTKPRLLSNGSSSSGGSNSSSSSLMTNGNTDMVSSDDTSNRRLRTSLIERSFKAIGGNETDAIKRLLSNNDVDNDDNKTSKLASEVIPIGNDDDGGDVIDMTMSDYNDLLSENMKQKYFPKGHVVYNEGDVGNHMYLINSGTVSVRSNDGIVNKRHAGDFFGEDALLHPNKVHSTTIKCSTPVHVIEISREYFEKYTSSSSGVALDLREKDKIRRRNRAKALLKLQSGMKSVPFKRGETLFKEGDVGDSLYIIESGNVDITARGHQVFVAMEGNFAGEHSLLTGRARNTTATCLTEGGCIATRMLGPDFRKLMDASPDIKESLTDMMNRRDFKKAVVIRLGHEFPYNNPREAFDAVDVKRRGVLHVNDVTRLMRSLDKDYTDFEVQSMMNTLDLSRDGEITFDEFKKVFIGDIRTTQSM